MASCSESIHDGISEYNPPESLEIQRNVFENDDSDIYLSESDNDEDDLPLIHFINRRESRPEIENEVGGETNSRLIYHRFLHRISQKERDLPQLWLQIRSL